MKIEALGGPYIGEAKATTACVVDLGLNSIKP
jgi:hypothetical protein